MIPLCRRGEVAGLRDFEERAQPVERQAGNVEKLLELIHDCGVSISAIIQDYKIILFPPCYARMKNAMHYDIIGDVHGRFDKLTTLMNRLGYQKDGDGFVPPPRTARSPPAATTVSGRTT